VYPPDFEGNLAEVAAMHVPEAERRRRRREPGLQASTTSKLIALRILFSETLYCQNPSANLAAEI
jgi:hypothetical protein